jgi:uncharacterized protein YndB with AHSA1/START domain
MENGNSFITVRVTVKIPVEKCWKLWTTAGDIMQWNNPSADWHSPRVETDLKEGGRFLFRMETKDGSIGFDHSGQYDKVIVNERIEYTGTDGRRSIIVFTPDGNDTTITESFEPETKTPLDVQRDFCQGVLDNFKKYAEK